MRRFCLVYPLAFLALTACPGTNTPPPAVEIRTVRVEVPVAVTCLTAEQYRDLIAREPAKIAGSLTGDAIRDLDLVSASALRLRAYGRELQAALKACAKID